MKPAIENTYRADLDKDISTLFADAFGKGFFSGAAAGYCANEKTKIWTFGTTDITRKKCITDSTFFDLASLTKPMVTTLSLLAIMEEKGIALDTPLKYLLKRTIPPQMQEIQMGQLMAHCSGLPGYRPYFEELTRLEKLEERKERIIDNIVNEKLEYKAGAGHVYSDLGYILLGAIVEEISGLSLAVYWSTKIAKPIDLQEKLFFNPENNTKNKGVFAATEKCPWSGIILSGCVHDDNCRALGGVAGHAGLFGTIDGVLQFCNHLVRQFRGEEKHPAYSNEKLRQILSRHGNSTWTYGFDTPSKKGSSSGRYFSNQSVGHLGFTGTSFWIDLSRGICLVLLTNRVHPSRQDERIKLFRPRFHDAIMKHLLES